MDRYLNEIARYPLMTAAEEIRLARLVQQMMQLKKKDEPLTPDEQRIVKRGERAKKRFVEANLRLVVYIAKKYASRQPVSMDILDLIQEGAVGLMRAVDMFDPNRGYKFSTYAYWWCRQSMTRALHVQERMIRRPHTVIEIAGKLPKAVTEETQRLGRAPKPSELAAKLNVKESEILLLMERGRSMISLDTSPTGIDDKTILEIIPDPNSTYKAELEDAMDFELQCPLLELGLSSLTDNERLFVEMRYGLNGHAPHTYESIAKAANPPVSRERIRQVLDKSIRKLRYQLALNTDPIAAVRKNEAAAAKAKEPPYLPVPKERSPQALAAARALQFV